MHVSEAWSMVSQASAAAPDVAPALSAQANFDALVQVIARCQATLTSKIDSLQMKMSLVQRDFDKIRGRVDEVERRVGDTKDIVRDHSATLHTVQQRLKHLESRAEDAENRNRRNNLRIVGLPEGREGSDTTGYTERLLHTLFPTAAFSPQFVVERAHRMPPVCGPPGAPPRTVIFKLLNFRDQDMILREARKMDDIRHEDAHLMFFLDFSVDTQRRRKSFDAVKQSLRARNIKYSMLFPTRLRVVDGESSRFFCFSGGGCTLGEHFASGLSPCSWAPAKPTCEY